jgi:hypothetical protein
MAQVAQHEANIRLSPTSSMENLLRCNIYSPQLSANLGDQNASLNANCHPPSPALPPRTLTAGDGRAFA